MPQVLFRFVALAVIVTSSPLIRGQDVPGDECADILISQIDSSKLDDASSIEYIKRIDENTYNAKKHDAGFAKTLNVVYEGIPIGSSLNANYSDWSEARR